MIEVTLKKIIELDTLKDSIISNLKYYLKEDQNELLIDGTIKNIDEISLSIKDNLKINFYEDDFSKLLTREKWKQNYDTGLLLYKKLQKFTEFFGDFLDESFLVYLTHIPIIKNYIIKRYFSNVDECKTSREELTKKIKNYFFGEGIVSRTGLIFNLKLTATLFYKNIGNKSDELCQVAFSFIDSVKSIYERSFRKNPLIVKAFVEGIIINNRSAAFKDKKYRTLIPTHISNLAAINCLDAYPYSDLIEKIASEQKKMIKKFNKKV